MAKNPYRTIEERATIYAAFKALESIAKPADGKCELPPDTHMEVGGNSVTITIPDGWKVDRAEGDENGMVEKTATQNTYGYAVFLTMLKQAKKFNQHKLMMRLIVDAIEDALRNQTTTKAEMIRLYPEMMKDLDVMMEEMKKQLPARKEPTRRYVDKPTKAQPVLSVHSTKEPLKTAS